MSHGRRMSSFADVRAICGNILWFRPVHMYLHVFFNIIITVCNVPQFCSQNTGYRIGARATYNISKTTRRAVTLAGNSRKILSHRFRDGQFHIQEAAHLRVGNLNLVSSLFRHRTSR